jgi:predicted LPLAT superfamily acyltransferase
VADWRTIPEAGTVFSIRLVVLMARLFRRRFAGWVLYLVSLYYLVIRGGARRASREYLRRAGAPDGLGSVARHLHTFARVSLDRLFFVTGNWAPFAISYQGHELLIDAARSGRGALLVGAHLGSFEVLRSRAQHTGVPINVVVDFSNAERITTVLRSLAPEIDARLLPLDRDPVVTVIAIKNAIERGELVAMLADRLGRAGGAERQVMAPFLGADAPFPAGPWFLAHALKCPVYFVAGLYREPNRYDLHCELIANEVVIDSQERAASLRTYVGKYAATLERYARLAPYNWFNFHEFWRPR